MSHSRSRINLNVFYEQHGKVLTDTQTYIENMRKVVVMREILTDESHNNDA